MMIEITDNMTTDEIRAGLIQRADQAIAIRERIDVLAKGMEESERELERTLKDIADWLDLLDDSLISLSRGGYFIGWVEEEPDSCSMTITRETPADHIDLG